MQDEEDALLSGSSTSSPVPDHFPFREAIPAPTAVTRISQAKTTAIALILIELYYQMSTKLVSHFENKKILNLNFITRSLRT